MAKRDWFDYADAAQRLRMAERALHFDLEELAPGMWGERGVGVICVGSRADMERVQDKRRADMLYQSNGRTVAERLPIWC